MRNAYSTPPLARLYATMPVMFSVCGVSWRYEMANRPQPWRAPCTPCSVLSSSGAHRTSPPPCA